MAALLGTDVVLAAVVLALMATLALLRARSRRRRTRVEAARERFELMVAERLAGDGPTDLPAVDGALERAVLRDVGVAALLELRGGERDRLAAMLETAGVVDDEAALLADRRPSRRRRAADVLGLVGTQGVREPLRAALGDADAGVRLAAARGLAELGDTEAASMITEIADVAAEHHAGAVAELVLALGTRAPAALRALFATSRVPEVRRLVVATIGELRLAQHAPLLREALDEGDDELAARAARGLGMIGDADATPDLLGLVADAGRSWFVRTAATTALGLLGDPSAVRPLAAELTDSPEWPLRRAAAEALARLGPSGIASLRGVLESPEPAAHEHARAALDSR